MVYQCSSRRLYKVLESGSKLCRTEVKTLKLSRGMHASQRINSTHHHLVKPVITSSCIADRLDISMKDYLCYYVRSSWWKLINTGLPGQSELLSIIKFLSRSNKNYQHQISLIHRISHTYIHLSINYQTCNFQPYSSLLCWLSLKLCVHHSL